LHRSGLQVPIAVQAGDEEVGDPDKGKDEGDAGEMREVAMGIERVRKEAALIAHPENERERQVYGNRIGNENEVFLEFPGEHYRLRQR
jgi:hypothetical protein